MCVPLCSLFLVVNNVWPEIARISAADALSNAKGAGSSEALVKSDFDEIEATSMNETEDAEPLSLIDCLCKRVRMLCMTILNFLTANLSSKGYTSLDDDSVFNDELSESDVDEAVQVFEETVPENINSDISIGQSSFDQDQNNYANNQFLILYDSWVALPTILKIFSAPFLILYTWVKADTMVQFMWRYPRLGNHPTDDDNHPQDRKYVQMSKKARSSDDDDIFQWGSPSYDPDTPFRPQSRQPRDEPWF